MKNTKLYIYNYKTIFKILGVKNTKTLYAVEWIKKIKTHYANTILTQLSESIFVKIYFFYMPRKESRREKHMILI